MSTPSKNQGWSAADEQLLGAVRAALVGTHEVVGTIGRDMHGLPALVAREAATGELVVLLLDRDPDAASSSTELTLVERRELDDTIPAPDIPCPICRAPQRAWSHSCAVCGNEVDGAAFSSGIDRAELLDMVRRATSDEMDVLGAMSHAGTGDGPGAPAFFARERSTRKLVALRLTGRTVDEAGRSDITLGVIPLPTLGLPVPPESPDIASPPTVAPTPGRGIATISLLREALAAAAEPAPAEERVCPQCGAEYPAGVRFCARDGAALRARTASNEMVGQIIAEKYLVLRKLGVGGMGEVYLARHVHMGRECALKIMRRELTDDFDAAGRFRREAANASRVNHPNIATIYDFGETADGIAYIVMEYVDGEPLSAILGREGKLEPARAVALARQIADALGAAHELGIVHRDLKPDNVMIARSHGVERVKVVDFGIAKAIQGGSRQLTRTGYVLGTPAYMSPEQIVGGDLDGRSDQYNLACILFEMLTGQVTFAGTTGEIVIHRRLTEPPPHPRKLEPTVPRSIDAVVVHALARTPEERFADAAEFGRALGAALSDSGKRWSPLAWLARGRAAPGSVKSVEPITTAPPAARSTPAEEGGVTAPRIRPPTGAQPRSSVRIAPPPAPPSSPAVARPKWPDANTAGSGAQSGGGGGSGSGIGGGSGGSASGIVGADVSGAAPAGSYGAEGTPPGYSSRAEDSPLAVSTTGERSGESAMRSAREPSQGYATLPAENRGAGAPRRALTPLRIAAAAGILVAGAAGAALYMNRSAPETTAGEHSTSPVTAASRPGEPSSSAPGAAPPTAPGSMASPATGAGTVPAGDSTKSTVGAAPSGDVAREAASTPTGAGNALPSPSSRTGNDLAANRGTGQSVEAASGQRGGETASAGQRQAPGSGAASTPQMSEAGRQEAPSRQSTQVIPPASTSSTTLPTTTAGTAGAAGANSDPAAAAAAERAAATTVLRGYVAALSRRDLAAMRRLWPTMPDNTAKAFENLFKLATNFSATAGTEPDPQLRGADADAELRYSLEYFIPSQGAQKQSFRLHAIMHRDGGNWTIRSLEPIR